MNEEFRMKSQVDCSKKKIEGKIMNMKLVPKQTKKLFVSHSITNARCGIGPEDNGRLQKD